MFNYFHAKAPRGKVRQEFHLYPKCVALARQNARSDRVCLDFSLVTFFVAMTKKVTIKMPVEEAYLVNNNNLRLLLKLFLTRQ
jgi:hypothetical protein